MTRNDALRFKAQHDPEESVTGLKLTDMNKLVATAAARLNLPDLIGPATMYRFRHSGPSADFATARRSVAEIKHRGRWVSDSSLRRYQKGGRVNDLLGRCSMNVKTYANMCLKEVPEILLDRRVAPPPPPCR